MADRAANPLRPNVGNQGHALRLAVQDGRGAQCPDAAPRLFPSPQAARTAHLRAGAQALRRAGKMVDLGRNATEKDWRERSEEHTSEIQSLMRRSYAVFCLKKKKQEQTQVPTYREK